MFCSRIGVAYYHESTFYYTVAIASSNSEQVMIKSRAAVALEAGKPITDCEVMCPATKKASLVRNVCQWCVPHRCIYPVQG